MELLNRLKSIVTGRKTLDRIPLDDLRKERIHLEQLEQRIGREVEDLERRKQDLFSKGKDEASQRQQIALARKIKELDSAAQAKDRQLAMISRQVRVLTGLMVLKESQALTRDLRLASVVSRMDLSELEKFVEKASVEGQFHMERFAQILRAMEPGEGQALAGEEADTLAIVAAMQEAKEAESTAPGAAVEEGMKKVNQILEEGRAAGGGAEKAV
ncbi:MAG: hypothetical protein HY721_17910 [Planctomycetes bacterium]|nr:hypothetical protein [Planctomycetota bacterium]